MTRLICFSSPEPKGSQGELIGWASSRRPCTRSFAVNTFKHFNISETSGPIAIKFCLKRNWVERKTALGFRPDRIRTKLVSMAADSSNRVIMVKML